MLALHIPHFASLAEFRERVDRYISLTKNSTGPDGSGEILLPGERGFREHQRRAAEGIPVRSTVWEATHALAREVGLDLAPVLEAAEAAGASG
jgi:LDH2 family malate/lactate/ureidoglycolate dehydrogenase